MANLTSEMEEDKVVSDAIPSSPEKYYTTKDSVGGQGIKDIFNRFCRETICLHIRELEEIKAKQSSKVAELSDRIEKLMKDIADHEEQKVQLEEQNAQFQKNDLQLQDTISRLQGENRQLNDDNKRLTDLNEQLELKTRDLLDKNCHMENKCAQVAEMLKSLKAQQQDPEKDECQLVMAEEDKERQFLVTTDFEDTQKQTAKNGLTGADSIFRRTKEPSDLSSTTLGTKPGIIVKIPQEQKPALKEETSYPINSLPTADQLENGLDLPVTNESTDIQAFQAEDETNSGNSMIKRSRENSLQKNRSEMRAKLERNNEYIEHLSKALSANNWEPVLRMLGVDPNTLSDIKHDFSNAYTQRYEAIKQWFQQEGLKATPSRIVEALRDCNLRSVAESFCLKFDMAELLQEEPGFLKPQRSFKKKRITKAEISRPLSFMHVAHVGYDPNQSDQGGDSTVSDISANSYGAQDMCNDPTTMEFIKNLKAQITGGIDSILYGTPKTQ